MIRIPLLGLVFGWIAMQVQAQEKPLDLCLVGGTVFDGTGQQGKVLDVGIRDGKIVAMGSLGDRPSLQVIDCHDLWIAPGFIDLHNHSDDTILASKTRGNSGYLIQGCTTIVTGNCGSGPVDVKRYLQKIDEQGAGTHVLHLLPHGDLRSTVMGKESRDPTAEEIDKMRALARAAMQDGAWGMSTGLIYVPGTYSKTEEIIEVAKVVSEYRGIYASHIRNEGEGLIDSIEEAIRIGKEARLPIHVSHMKASGKSNWGSLRVATKLIEDARAKGASITADQYPYVASSTSLEATLLPSWSREGGRKGLEKRLENPEERAKIREAVAKQLRASQRIQITSHAKHREWAGKSLDEIAKIVGQEVVDVVLDIESNGGAGVVNFSMNEDDVRQAMQLPWVATASDGGAKIPSGDRPHPRSFGTFSRKIGYYANDQKVLDPAAAIRSCSGLPADIIGMKDRGYLREGLAADLVVLDPKQYRDTATYDEPFRYATGVVHVLMDGQYAVYRGTPTGALLGKALRKPQ